MDSETDNRFMQHAIDLAAEAEARGEVPVAAIIVMDNEIVGRGFNRCIADNDPTAHAEVVAMRDAAARIGNYRLNDAILYVTLEPCMMCAGAMVHARIARLVYGATDPKSGVIHSCYGALEQPFLNHRIEVTSGVMAEQCSRQLSGFFRKRRQEKNSLQRR